MSPDEVSQASVKRRPGKTPFEIVVNENVKPPILSLKGDVDVAVAEKLHEQLSRLVERGHNQLTIDCEGVSYFDSTGLSELVWAVRRMPDHGRVRLVGCSPRLIKLLNVTGLDNIFELVLPSAA
ncbi:MAG TPA: STAS domain-containing protein [Armatimonadota bacterium]|nr:STAS domain-containing protein [Armatimonadota bacterium]